MEATATDNKDKPTTDIKLVSAHIFVDSISDTREELINLEKEKKKAAKEAEKSKVNETPESSKALNSLHFTTGCNSYPIFVHCYRLLSTMKLLLYCCNEICEAE